MKARAQQVLVGPPAAVGDLYTDPRRWPSWLDGFGHVVAVRDGWPEAGGVAEWASRPGGRGRVRERVLEHEPGARLVVEVEDESLRGTQTAVLEGGEEGARIDVVLEYELKERNLLTPLTDILFIRRSLAASLQRSLARLARERAGDADLER